VSTWTLERSRIARMIKAGCPPDSPEILTARQRLRELLVIDQVRRVIDAAAPLTDEQRARITELLAAR
jgi:hypothetical protein